jgi:hypothetical protein
MTQQLVAQLSFYRLDDKNIEQDHVIALALANRAYEQSRKATAMDTQIDDDLAVVQARSGTLPMHVADGPGTIFALDPDTGLYYPAKEVTGWEF